MKFYHATTPIGWIRIQKLGYLGRKRSIGKRKLTPVTYLACKKEYAGLYGKGGKTILLEVDYIPSTNRDNYISGCWQIRVYGRIPLSKIRRLI